MSSGNSQMTEPEFSALITLITSQEERITKKIGEVHDDVLITNQKITDQNGRLRKNEIDIAKIQVLCEIRGKTCGKTLEGLKPNIKATKFINLVSRNPKVSLSIFIGTMILFQSLILLAIEHEWLGELVKLIKP